MGFMNNYYEDIEWCEDTNGFEPNVCDFLADYDAYLYSLEQEQQLESCIQESCIQEPCVQEPMVTNTKNTEHKSKPDSNIEDVEVEQENGLVGIIRVCKKTGEVLARYETVPVTKLSKLEYNRQYKVVPSPINARNSDHINDYCKLQRKNRSKIVKTVDLKEYADTAAGQRRYGNYKQPNITKPVLNVLEALCSAVKIHNVIVGTRAELASVLGVRENHLQRKLSMVKEYVKVFDEKDGMNKGFMKIAITPHFVFAGAGSMLYQQREQAMKDWYIRDLVAEAVGSNRYADHIDWLCKPSNRVLHEDHVKFSEEFEAYLKSFSTKNKGGEFIV